MSCHIFYCEPCKEFTLHLNCPKCAEKAGFFKPPKYSVQDKWANLKRKALEPGRKKSGVL